MKKQTLILIIAIICISWACSDEPELQKSIYVEDAAYPGLPQYSELGYNTFGAYYDREPFISSSDVPVKITVTNGKTVLAFNGQKRYSGMSIAFTMTDFTAQQYSDLIALNGKVLNLTDAKYKVVIVNESIENQAQIISGTLKFNRAQKVFVDTKEVELILSGHFEFQALINGQPVTLSNGRFDVGVGTSNFYTY